MGFMDKLKGMFGKAKDVAGDAVDTVQEAAGDAVDKVQDVAGDAVDKVKDVAEDIKDKFDGDDEGEAPAEGGGDAPSA